MPITDWPLQERPRERLLKAGAPSLSNTELLAIFLRTGVPGKTALDVARHLLNSFGTLRNLLEAPYDMICRHPGMGSAKYAQLQAALELTRRHIHESLQYAYTFSSTQQTKQFLISKLRHHKREVFACLFLDSKNHLLAFEELFFGTINAATIHPREVVKRALYLNAAAVIFSHNHPSGIAEPSLHDQHITQQLTKALSLVDVQVLDHMIVGDSQVASLAELGLLLT